MLRTAILAAVGACALATAAAAGTGEEKVVATVTYADLDLGTKAGSAKLKSRIRWAATKVCSDYQRPAPTGLEVNRRCFREAMDGALRQMDRAIAQQAVDRSITIASVPRNL